MLSTSVNVQPGFGRDLKDLGSNPALKPGFLLFFCPQQSLENHLLVKMLMSKLRFTALQINPV